MERICKETPQACSEIRRCRRRDAAETLQSLLVKTLRQRLCTENARLLLRNALRTRRKHKQETQQHQ